jgi:cytochrome c5
VNDQVRKVRRVRQVRWVRCAMLTLIVLGGARAGAQTLPDGAGKEVVQARCLTCHEADLIVEQRLTRTGWERSVDKMVRWGAVVGADQREPLVTYLAAHFRPKTVAAHTPGGTEVPPSTVGESAYKRACLTCHEADIVEQQRLTRAGWVRSVDKMVRWGAVVPEAERDPLADYLAARFPPR